MRRRLDLLHSSHPHRFTSDSPLLSCSIYAYAASSDNRRLRVGDVVAVEIDR
ncbi:hypothetical protein ANCCAN_29124 [Ancylostoma caninum]|uniref:Uncharacterized protein n=1 Tax=Ancylostoma caninum TaxID=29170 RepID=A0A368F2P3_ANCCA|nr:hypothetical protein ANCCAN_29124 [Ancylostoma caninum]